MIASVGGYSPTSVNKNIGHFPEPKNKLEAQIDFSVSAINKLYEVVREKISQKANDLDFACAWGEYQKAHAILITSWPKFKKLAPISPFSKQNSKEDARQWFALWFDWYLTQPNEKVLTRVRFDRKFEELLKEFKDGKRLFPSHEIEDAVTKLVVKYWKSSEDFQLTDKFRAKDFCGALLYSTRDTGKQNLSDLPPIGLKFYPKK